MADFEPPSFSLGLDLDTQLEPQNDTRPLDPFPQATAPSIDAGGFRADSLDELQREEVMDSDVEPEPRPIRVLKRLRRGPGAGLTNESLSPSSEKKQEMELRRTCANGDDEIEEFSSQDDLLIREDHSSAHYHSVCSSSKIPLRGQGVLTSQSSSHWKARKKEQASDAPSFASLGASQNGLMFPKLTVSPLRRFQLLDSDSDSDSDYLSVSGDVSKRAHRADPSSVQPKSTASKQKEKVLVEEHHNDNLWKDFCPMKSIHIPTPALDEVCEEYFDSVKSKNAASNDEFVGKNKASYPKTDSCVNFEQCWDSTNPLPSAHQYFFHEDPRIQKLARNRLPHFSPLGIVASNRGNQQPGTSVIDYMSQFNNGQAARQKGTREINGNKSSKRGRKKSSKSNEEVLLASEGWVDPKSSATIPKDAGKRRVHPNGQSGGHWYTSPEGKKVYVSRSGQELTGQFAYRQYRKDSGSAFKKSKRKTGSKKKKG